MKFIVSITQGRRPSPRQMFEAGATPVKTLALRQTINCVLCVCTWLSALSIYAQSTPPIRVAVLDFGDTPTGIRAADTIRKDLLDRSTIVLIDQNLATAAARGNGFQGSLNLSTEEARDIGAAIGCDFFVIGDAQTLA